MSNTKISALPAGTPAQFGDELPVARSGANYFLTVSDVAGSMIGSISQFSPAADGITDDSSKFTTAQGTYNEIWLAPNKQYAIGTNLTLTASLRFAPGSQLVIKTGVTLTLSGTLQAPLNQIFVIQGTGKVVMGSRNNNYDVYPEWWGAAGDGATDDTVAIQAAITAVSGAGLGYMTTESSTQPSGIGTVWLGAKTYKITAGLTIQASFVRIQGMGQRASVLMCNSATADILSVAGTILNNTGAAAFVYLADFAVMRNVAPSGTPAGIIYKFAIWCSAWRVESWDSIRGFSLGTNGVGQIRLYDCQAVGGNQTGTNAGSAAGFYLNGSLNSSRLTNCVVSSNGYGFYFNGVADAWLDRCETETGLDGFYVTGSATDVICTSCVVEGGGHSINVQSNNPTTGKVQFTNGYWHGGSILIQGSSNFEIIGGDINAPAANNAVLINGGSHDCLIQGLLIYVTGGASTAIPIVIDGTSGTTRIAVVNNVLQAPVGTPGNIGIDLINSAQRCAVNSNTIGGYFTTGINFDTTSGNNACVGNVIDPTHVTTPLVDAATGNTKLNSTT